MSYRKELAVKIVETFVTSNIEENDKEYLVSLVIDLLGERKNWYRGLQDKMVLPKEVAGGILGHVYIDKNGYFHKNSLSNFEDNEDLVNVLSSIT